MKYKLLGRSGLRVSRFCLGTMTFGDNWGWGADAAESRRMFDCFVDQGGNFVDTSNLYTFGDAERILGDIVTPDKRHSVVLGSKYTDAAPGTDPNKAGNHRKNMIQTVEGCLSRLNTDYLDILYVHTWDFTCRPDEVMRALDDLVRQGKILYTGISDAPAWVIARCNELAEQKGWSPFVVNQIEYSLIERTSDREQLPMCRALDIGAVAWSPLAGGVLTGKYTRASEANSLRRMDAIEYKALSERNLAIAREVDAIADELECSSAQVALAWVDQQGVIPILGGRNAQQILNNIAYLDVTLLPQHTARLEACSQIELGFPHDFFASAKGFVFGGMFDKVERHRDEGIGRSGEERSALKDGNFNYTDVVVDGSS